MGASAFKARRVTKEYCQTIDAAPDRGLPAPVSRPGGRMARRLAVPHDLLTVRLGGRGGGVPHTP